jgi:hypothetical protein
MPSNDEIIQEAIHLCQIGNKDKASTMLVSMLRANPSHEQGWWLLAACIDSPKQKQDCLQRVLALNPDHLGAKLFLELIRTEQQVPDLYNTSSLTKNNPNAADEDNNGFAQTSPFVAADPLPLINPDTRKLMDHAQQAEKSQDFSLAFQLYSHALDIDTSNTLAWLGKGYASGRLSTGDKNNIPEFFLYLTQAILSRDHQGLPISEAITQIDPHLAQAASDRLLRLAHYTAKLAISTPQPMANVYAIERVHLTDWAYVIGRRLDTVAGLWCSRSELISVTFDAFQRIIQNVNETSLTKRARLERLQPLKSFLLSNLSTSGLNHDPDFLKELEEMLVKGIAE